MIKITKIAEFIFLMDTRRQFSAGRENSINLRFHRNWNNKSKEGVVCSIGDDWLEANVHYTTVILSPRCTKVQTEK